MSVKDLRVPSHGPIDHHIIIKYLGQQYQTTPNWYDARLQSQPTCIQNFKLNMQNPNQINGEVNFKYIDNSAIKDADIGEATVPLTKLFKHKGGSSIQLVNLYSYKGQLAGELTIETKYMSPQEVQEQAIEKELLKEFEISSNRLNYNKSVSQLHNSSNLSPSKLH